MVDHASSYSARILARSHSIPEIGWSQGTVLFVDIERAPNDEGIVRDVSAGFDVTQSMTKLLEGAAAKRGLDYAAPAYPNISCDGLPHLGGGPLPKAIVLAEADKYVALLPDGRKEDVTADVSTILDQRLGFLGAGHSEEPRRGSVLAKMSMRFTVPAPGAGDELLQHEMTREDQLASISDPDVRIRLAQAHEMFDLGTAYMNGEVVGLELPDDNGPTL